MFFGTSCNIASDTDSHLNEEHALQVAASRYEENDGVEPGESYEDFAARVYEEMYGEEDRAEYGFHHM